ncbi:MAG: M20/M25/M40 family metallo-hydrolase [Kofleriaceae bacterium]
MRALPLIVVAACSAPQAGSGSVPAWVSDTSSYGSAGAPAPKPLVERYRPEAERIIATARADRGAYTKLAELTDRIGNRVTGSPQLDQAIAWASKSMKDDGFEVRTEPVPVTVWQRGVEEAAITQPIARPLRLIGLGGSVATPKGGVTAPVIVIRSFEELDKRADEVKGRIVLYDVAMPVYSETTGSGYGDVVKFRGRGPSRAAKLGAVAVLMRSVTAHSLRTPHTGALRYDPEITQLKIPAAAVTVEDSALLVRLAEKGPVSVKLVLESKSLEGQSANVIGELRGKDKPDEIVVLGAHLDSWDVGQGAHDDGAGCVTMMQAITTLKRLGLQPRRTIRVVLFTNEENGLAGGRTYAKVHAEELSKHVLALEADSGGFAPRGFTVETKPETSTRVVARVAEIAALLRPINATLVRAGHGGADIGEMVAGGVPTLGLDTDGRTYFDIHHTEADTLDKVDPAALADGVAAVAVLAYIVADLPDRVDAP